jgi:hypothetical protein
MIAPASVPTVLIRLGRPDKSFERIISACRPSIPYIP